MSGSRKPAADNPHFNFPPVIKLVVERISSSVDLSNEIEDAICS